LEARGFSVRHHYFADAALLRGIYAEPSNPRVIARTLARMLTFLRDIAAIGRPDVVFLQRETELLGPPLAEWLLRRGLGAPVV
jgi:hypothetical protein